MAKSFKKAVAAKSNRNTDMLDYDESNLALDGEYKLIAVTDIYAKEQLRTEFNEEGIEALMHSIISEGQIQPIVVSPSDSKGYCIQKGERRWRAAKLSNGQITHLECIVKKDGTLLQQFSENFVREDFTPFEIGNAFVRIKAEKAWNNKDLAKHFSLSEPVVSAYIKCVDAPEFVQEAYRQGKVADVDTINVLRVAASTDAKETELFLKSDERFTRKQAQEFNKALKTKSKQEPELQQSQAQQHSGQVLNDDPSKSCQETETEDYLESELDRKTQVIAPTIKEPKLRKVKALNRILVSVDGEFGVIDSTATANEGAVVVLLDNNTRELTVPVTDVVLVGYVQD